MKMTNQASDLSVALGPVTHTILQCSAHFGQTGNSISPMCFKEERLSLAKTLNLL